MSSRRASLALRGNGVTVCISPLRVPRGTAQARENGRKIHRLSNVGERGVRAESGWEKKSASS